MAPAAAENVLEKGISTATSTHAHTRGVRARSHPHLPDPKASQPPARHFVRSNAHTRPPQHLNRAPKAGLAKSRGRHGSFPHYAHRRPNFTGDRSEARGHGAAHAALPPGWLGAGCACWCAPDGFAARKRRGGTQGAATPECARRRGPPPAWSSLMGLLRPHRAVAPAPRAPTDARGDHARPPPRILRLFSAVAKCQIRRFYLGVRPRQVPRQLRPLLRHWSSQVLPRSPRGVGLHET